MKKILFVFFIGIAGLKAFAGECIISGQQKNAKEKFLKLYLLYAGAHYRDQLVDIKLNKDGQFNQRIQLPYPVFALLKYEGYERRLLLSPGRSLHLVFDGMRGIDAIKLTGLAAAENELLFRLKIGDQPFFMKDKADEANAKMPVDDLQKNILDVLQRQYTDITNLIASANIPESLQSILLSEVHYSNQCYLYDLAGYYMRAVNNKDQEVFLRKVMEFEPVPDSNTLVSGTFANMSIEYLIRYSMINAAKDVRTDSTAIARRMQQIFGMPFNEVSQQVEKYGERYILNWLYAKNNIPASVRDKILFNRIIESCDSKELSAGLMLMDTLQYYFPRSKYLPMAHAELNELQKIKRMQLNNSKIIVHEEKKISSFSELTKLHKGKVIYVDIWGTWCGPCRIEMNYVPELKKRFADRDIVFIYIDMDKPSKQDLWKEMLHLFALEGEHYRLDNNEIAPLWKEIEKEGGHTNLYPTFVLFDKTGKMIKPNAKRPGDREVLYKELEAALH
ncbi:MAG: TlpA disulfide reductase family protein [Agriterribacter sp.]